MRPHCPERTLPHKVQIKDSIVEGKKFEIECPLEIDHHEAPITCPNAVHSAYPGWTWTIA